MNSLKTAIAIGLIAIINTQLYSQHALIATVTEAEVYANGYTQLYVQYETALRKGLHSVTLLLSGRDIQTQSLAAEVVPSGKMVRMSDIKELNCNDDDSCRYYTEQTKLLREKIQAKSLELEKLDAREKLLMENARLTGSNHWNMQLLRDALQFLHHQLSEVKDARSKAKKQLDELQRDYQNLQSQLNQRTQYIKNNFRKLTILVETKSDGLYTFNFSYISTGLRWNRQQEIDIDETKEKAYLKNLAQVHSDFHETWRNVKLTLIDKAFEFSEKPLQVRPLRVIFPSPIITYIDRSENSNRIMAKVLTPATLRGALTPEDEADVEASKQQMTDGEIYILTGSYTLSSFKPLQAELSTDSLSVRLHFVVAPYMINKVQLLAVVRERTEAISETPSVVRLNGRPVGINNAPIIYNSDSAAFQLGFIKDVVVQRKRENPYSSRSLLGNTQRDMYEYSISIINRRQVPISITVIDRIPVSTDSQIEVKLKKAEKALPDQHGLMRWNVTIPPGKQHIISFAYEISYPKGRNIAFMED